MLSVLSRDPNTDYSGACSEARVVYIDERTIMKNMLYTPQPFSCSYSFHSHSFHSDSQVFWLLEDASALPGFFFVAPRSLTKRRW